MRLEVSNVSKASYWWAWRAYQTDLLDDKKCASCAYTNLSSLLIPNDCLCIEKYALIASVTIQFLQCQCQQKLWNKLQKNQNNEKRIYNQKIAHQLFYLSIGQENGASHMLFAPHALSQSTKLQWENYATDYLQFQAAQMIHLHTWKDARNLKRLEYDHAHEKLQNQTWSTSKII